MYTSERTFFESTIFKNPEFSIEEKAQFFQEYCQELFNNNNNYYNDNPKNFSDLEEEQKQSLYFNYFEDFYSYLNIENKILLLNMGKHFFNTEYQETIEEKFLYNFIKVFNRKSSNISQNDIAHFSNFIFEKPVSLNILDFLSSPKLQTSIILDKIYLVSSKQREPVFFQNASTLKNNEQNAFYFFDGIYEQISNFQKNYDNIKNIISFEALCEISQIYKKFIDSHTYHPQHHVDLDFFNQAICERAKNSPYPVSYKLFLNSFYPQYRPGADSINPINIINDHFEQFSFENIDNDFFKMPWSELVLKKVFKEIKLSSIVSFIQKNVLQDNMIDLIPVFKEKEVFNYLKMNEKPLFSNERDAVNFLKIIDYAQICKQENIRAKMIYLDLKKYHHFQAFRVMAEKIELDTKIANNCKNEQNPIKFKI